MSETITTFCNKNLQIKDEEIDGFIKKFRFATNHENSVGFDYDEGAKIRVLKQMRRYVRKLDNLDQDKKEGLLVLLDHLRYNLILRVIWKTPVKYSMPLLDDYLTSSELLSDYHAINTYEVFSNRGLDDKKSQHTENNYLFELGSKYNEFIQKNNIRTSDRPYAIGQARTPIELSEKKKKPTIIDLASRKAKLKVKKLSQRVDEYVSSFTR